MASPPAGPGQELMTDCWIEQLPSETLLMIFEKLKACVWPGKSTLVQCTLVCRRWSILARRVLMYELGLGNPNAMVAFFNHFTLDSIRTKLRVRRVRIDTNNKDPNKVFVPSLCKLLSALPHVAQIQLRLLLPVRQLPLKSAQDWTRFGRIIGDRFGSQLTYLQVHFVQPTPITAKMSDEMARLVWNLPRLLRLEIIGADLDSFYPGSSDGSSTDCVTTSSQQLRELTLVGTWTCCPRLLNALKLSSLIRFTLHPYRNRNDPFPVQCIMDTTFPNLRRFEGPPVGDGSYQKFFGHFHRLKICHLWSGWGCTLEAAILGSLPATVEELCLNFFHLDDEELFLSKLADQSILESVRTLRVHLLREVSGRFRRWHEPDDCFKDESIIRAICTRRGIVLYLNRRVSPALTRIKCLA